MLFSKHFSLNILLSMIIVLQSCSLAEDETHVLLREARVLEAGEIIKKPKRLLEQFLS